MLNLLGFSRFCQPTLFYSASPNVSTTLESCLFYHYSPGICPSGWVPLKDPDNTFTYQQLRSDENAALCCSSDWTAEANTGCLSSWTKKYQFATHVDRNFQLDTLITTSGTLDGRSIVEQRGGTEGCFHSMERCEGRLKLGQ